MRSSSFPLISRMSSLIIYAYDETIQQCMVCFEVSGFRSFLKILGMESILYELFVLQDTYSLRFEAYQNGTMCLAGTMWGRDSDGIVYLDNFRVT